MSLRDYLDSFHQAIGKIDDYGFAESIKIGYNEGMEIVDHISDINMPYSAIGREFRRALPSSKANPGAQIDPCGWFVIMTFPMSRRKSSGSS
jgi:hypothetical protein